MNIRSIFGVGALGILSASCANTGGYGGANNNGAIIGAGLGAVGGAIVGEAMTKGQGGYGYGYGGANNSGAIIGAGIGAVGGAILGQKIQQQQP